MNRTTLPRRARTQAPGWSHPYRDGLFSPVFYRDGGQDDQNDGADTDDGTDEGADADIDDGTGQDDRTDQGQDDDGDQADDGAADLGDKGKRALASMKGKWRSERDKRKDLETQLAQKDAGDEAATARREAEQAALARANGRIVRAEVKAAAKGVLADPGDAYRFLDLGQFEVDDDGNIVGDLVADAIEELVKNKPYLAAARATRFQGTGDGGAARKAGRPRQLSQQDLKSMTAEAIDKARIDGRLDDLMGGK